MSFLREQTRRMCIWAFLVCVGAAVSRAEDPSASVAPPNDDLANAATIEGASFTLNVDLSAATSEPFEVFQPGELDRTAWWVWRAPTTGIYRWDSSASASPIAVTVWNREGQGPLTAVAHSFRRAHRQDDQELRIEPDPTATFSAHAERMYWISLRATIPYYTGLLPSGPIPDPLTAHVVFDILPVPWLANDAFEHRTVLKGTSVTFGGALLAATSETGESLVPGDPVGRTRWWTWTAPGNGTATIRNLGSESAPVVAIYRIGAQQRRERITHSGTRLGNDCYEYWSGRDSIEWDTTDGEAYEIQMDGYPELPLEANHRLQLTFKAAPANDDLINAQVLPGPDLRLVVNNFAATLNPLDPPIAGATGEGSVWYKWNSPSPGVVQVGTPEPIRYAEPSFEILPLGGTYSYGSVSTSSDLPSCREPFVDLDPLPEFAPLFGLFQRVGGSGGRPIVEAGPSGTNATIGWVTTGEAYVQLDGIKGTSGQTNMNFLFTPPPINDEFQNRIVLPSGAVRVGGRTFAATPEAGDSAGPRGVWWEWTAPGPCVFVLTPKSWAGQTLFRLAPLDMVVDGRMPLDSRQSDGAPIVFYAEAGQTFAVYVSTTDLFGDNIGFTLDIAVGPPLTYQFEWNPEEEQFFWVLRWPLSVGIPQRLETSTNLLDWSFLDPSIEQGEGFAYIPLIDAEPIRFFRVKILPNQ
ncbi:MAG TPA: hypothetical protein DCE44_13590 [Verrucomicrobiales bacterium]|nr:hypothetical protein [Verrucomicrobiales bacterium]